MYKEIKVKYCSYFFLFISVVSILSLYWNIGFTGGDDPFIALDSLRKGGIWKASIEQAIGQGRFYYVLPWFLSQLSYVADSFAVTNTIKILTDVILFYFFFQFVKSVWNEAHALIASFIGLGIISWYGADFNPLHNVPLWYSLGTIFLLISFLIFNENLKKNSEHFFLAFVFYFIGLLFYEIFLFYAALFPILYFHNRIDSIRNQNLKLALLSILKAHKYLFLSIFIYLASYLIFRFYFPSGYEGSKELHFISFERTLRTIRRFSLEMGVSYRLPKLNEFPLLGLQSYLMATLVSIGLLISLLHLKNLNLTFTFNKLKLKSILLSLIVVSYFVFCPNILFGFVDKYHPWADVSPYYLGSFFSSIAIIIFVSIVLINIFLLFNRKFILILIYPFLLFNISIINFSKSAGYFSVFKKDYYKWPMATKVFNNANPQINNDDLVCTNSFFRYKDSYDIYDYWSVYLSNKIGKKINVKFSEKVDSNCQWVMNFSGSENQVMLSLTHLKSNTLFESHHDL